MKKGSWSNLSTDIVNQNMAIAWRLVNCFKGKKQLTTTIRFIKTKNKQRNSYVSYFNEINLPLCDINAHRLEEQSTIKELIKCLFTKKTIQSLENIYSMITNHSSIHALVVLLNICNKFGNHRGSLAPKVWKQIKCVPLQNQTLIGLGIFL